MNASGTRSGRAVFAENYGPAESYVLRSVPVASPGPGEIRVAVRARGVSFADLLIASGMYQVKPPLPYVPGTEFSGVIDAVGEGVRHDRVGTRVLVGASGAGSVTSPFFPSAPQPRFQPACRLTWRRYSAPVT